MRTRSLGLVLATTWALMGSALSYTFQDGYTESWAERHGPQFLLAWTEDDVATVRRALDKLEDEHLKDKQGIDDYLMGRRARIIEKLEAPAFTFVDASGRRWRTVAMSLTETTLTGFAVSRDRYCRAEDQDVDELDFLAAGVECYIRNTAAIALFARIEKTRHTSPGGAP